MLPAAGERNLPQRLKRHPSLAEGVISLVWVQRLGDRELIRFAGTIKALVGAYALLSVLSLFHMREL